VNGVIFTPEVPEDVRSAFELALNASRFALHRAQLSLTVTFSEDEAPGEDLFGWGVQAGDSLITLRRSLSPEQFRDETLHTLGHVFFAMHSDPATVSAWFDANGRPGTVADWIAAQWEARTSEAIAEFFRDVYLPTRLWDNRTLWTMRRDAFSAFVQIVDGVLCPDTPI
jgi:hypothetical protein